MKEQIKKLLPKNNFARHVAVLAGGTAAGRGVVIAASPLLTRLYTPDDFGLLGVFASLLAIGAVIASLRYQLAIPLPESDQDAANVTVLSLLVVLGMTLLCVISLAFWGDQLTATINTPGLTPYLWLLPLGLLLQGIYQVLNYWAIRKKAFTAIARTKLSQSVGMVLVQLGGYMLGPVALLFGQVTGPATGTTGLALKALKPSWRHFGQVQVVGIKQAASRWRRFPLYSTWGGAFNAATTQLPMLLFASLFSPATAGIYMLSERVLKMPATLIGQSIGNVFFSEAAEAARRQELTPLVASLHNRLSHIAMPPMLILILAGPNLFAFAFGEQWRQAGVFAQWMAPWLYVAFITSPLSTLLSVLERQSQGTALHLLMLVLSTGGLLYGSFTGGVLHSIALLSLGNTVGYMCFLAYVLYSSGNSVFLLVIDTVKVFLKVVWLVVPLIACNVVEVGYLYWSLGLGVSLALIFIFYFNSFKSWFKK